MEWVLAHMEDADFNDPLPAPAAAAGAAAAPASAKAADPDSLAMLTGMGFTSEQVSSSVPLEVMRRQTFASKSCPL